MAGFNVRKDLTTGKWISTNTPLTPNKKFRTEAEVIVLNQKRKIGIPFALKAQEFDISNWFDIDQSTKTWNLKPEYAAKYDLVRDAKGVVTAIKAKQQQYEAEYMKRYRNRGDRVTIKYDNYIPHQIDYSILGLLTDERKWDTYRSLDDYKEDSFRKIQNKSYLKDWKEWYQDGAMNEQRLKEWKQWDDYKRSERDYNDLDGDNDRDTTKRDTYLKRKREYNKEGTLKQDQQWTDYLEAHDYKYNKGNYREREKEWDIRPEDRSVYDDKGRKLFEVNMGS